jgi:hypothetical protein
MWFMLIGSSGVKMMFNIRKDFNCCKAVHCKNFGVIDSIDYVYKSKRLGYLAIECKACGSNPPWINNQLINAIFEEKIRFHFGRKLTHCKKCYAYFFFNDKNKAQLHGFTPAGTQRLKCDNCQHIYTASRHKNIDAMRAVLQTILDNEDINLAIKQTKLSTRLYYFYLEKLSLLFTNFSRLKEQEVMTRDYIALQTEGRVVHLKHNRGFYTLLTAESNSGYVLLQTTNITKEKLLKEDIYNSTENTIIQNTHANNLENEINNRYQQTLQRKHFERLLVGQLSPIKHCHLIYPNKLVYVHFSMLRAFIQKTERYGHYIELESSIRAAAMMSASPEIKTKRADIYYYFPFAHDQAPLNHKKVGWWNDRWSQFEHGAYSALTDSLKNENPFTINDTQQIARYYTYLNEKLNKSLNSFNSLLHFSEIHRVVFNFCQANNGQTAAVKFGLTESNYDPMTLLEEAVNLTDFNYG